MSKCESPVLLVPSLAYAQRAPFPIPDPDPEIERRSFLVAEGFEVDRWAMLGNLGLALAYALPFSIGGYFILKNREVAA